MSTAHSDSLRCFVAIEIPQTIQILLKPVQTHLQSEIRKASWTKSGNFHLTLKFLGDVHPETVDAVAEAVQNVAAAQKPFSIGFGGIGAFPTRNRPRVLWVGVKHGAETITHLAKSVNRELKPLGFAIDNRFHPHLTLARLRVPMNLKPLKSALCKYDTIDGATVNVNEITVMQSQLHPNGAIYTPLNVCQFSAKSSKPAAPNDNLGAVKESIRIC